ncbi:hypothetical protein [Altericista sp. CCNU0014]|uniref:hypothetical protein n=1 Tax=Altericista sp. CCNU0014 TaxID=3082949 RepID=UPI00384F9CDC
MARCLEEIPAFLPDGAPKRMIWSVGAIAAPVDCAQSVSRRISRTLVYLACALERL